jgi:hypothetical protein
MLRTLRLPAVPLLSPAAAIARAWRISAFSGLDVGFIALPFPVRWLGGAPRRVVPRRTGVYRPQQRKLRPSRRVAATPCANVDKALSVSSLLPMIQKGFFFAQFLRKQL